MKKRLGIIGFDDIAKIHYNELRRSDFFEVVGIYSCEPQGVCKHEIYSDLDLFLAIKPDILLVTSMKFNSELFRITKFCKQILLFAPVAKNVEAIKEIKYCCKSDNVLVGVGFFARFNQTLLSLKKALLKEEQIYSISITKTAFDNLTQEAIENIDLVHFLAGDIVWHSKLENLAGDKKSVLNVDYQMRLKSGILSSLHLISQCQIPRYCIEVVCKSGVYFGDLLNLKLRKYTQMGLQNLKVDSDISPLRIAYEQLYEFCLQNKFDGIAMLEEAIKAQEICL